MHNDIINTCLQLAPLGLTRGTSGNASVRVSDGMIITPSGIPYEKLTTHNLVKMTLDGKILEGETPSSEWRIHADIFKSHEDIRAVLHTHPSYCIALGCHKLEIPAFHYMVADAGGHNIHCADYATFGTQALSDAVLKALEGRKACLMAHHGMIATGKTLEKALALAVEVEALAEQYWHALQIGPVTCLSENEMQGVLEKFKDYSRG